ncbi:hypothetical protein RJ639_005185 [Escallonia herrerae]|uniref:Uncharacterized protein n=1 Tax=Escallonia herrerae TaxID=1293975 RepID=A0AA89AWJ9_9ASTE|nr:hypothetical protein RJ639_005185 [Escallonia herrerae]
MPTTPSTQFSHHIPLYVFGFLSLSHMKLGYAKVTGKANPPMRPARLPKKGIATAKKKHPYPNIKRRITRIHHVHGLLNLNEIVTPESESNHPKCIEDVEKRSGIATGFDRIVQYPTAVTAPTRETPAMEFKLGSWERTTAALVNTKDHSTGVNGFAVQEGAHISSKKLLKVEPPRMIRATHVPPDSGEEIIYVQSLIVWCVVLPSKDGEGNREYKSLDAKAGAESVKSSVVGVAISRLGDGQPSIVRIKLRLPNGVRKFGVRFLGVLLGAVASTCGTSALLVASWWLTVMRSGALDRDGVLYLEPPTGGGTGATAAGLGNSAYP